MSDQPPTLQAWHALVAGKDPAGLEALLADDVVFRSPAVFTPQEGRAATTLYLTGALLVLGPTMHYVKEWYDDSSAVLEFEANLDGTHVHGVDILRWNDDGKLDNVTVMVRPFRALQALVERMSEQLTRLSGN